jgi:hypothetical protein
MAKALAILGGILGLLIVVLSFVTPLFGIWSLNVSGSGTSGSVWIDVFGGYYAHLQVAFANPSSFNESMAFPGGQYVLFSLPGFLMLAGAILAFVPKRWATISGGILLLFSVELVFMFIAFRYPYFTMGNMQNIMAAIDITTARQIEYLALWGWTTVNAGVFAWTFYWQIGWGAFMAIVAGILALAGSRQTGSLHDSRGTLRGKGV